MWDWNNSKSLNLSSILLKVVFVFLIGTTALLPVILRWYDPDIGKTEFIVSLIILYLILLVAFVAVANLHKMLGNIKKGDVFVDKNTVNLRVLSYCCYAVAALFAVLGYYRSISFLIAGTAGFVGLILRVVKNVFARAVELREENDTTI